MKQSLDQLIEIAQDAVRHGSKILKNTRPQIISAKSDRDTYTDVDLLIEREVREYLTKHTPDFGFTGEEQGSTRHGDATWMLDPIDGTANYAHGIPLCAIQLALVHEGATVIAAISMPYFDAHYWAVKGGGAYVNDVKMRPSDTVNLSEAVVSIGDYATGDRAKEKNKTRISVTAALAEKVERVRMFGSAAHDFAWMAEGRIDATVILSNNPLDIAAGVLLARESGAEVRDSSGHNYNDSSTDVIAATPGIIDDLCRLM